MGNLHKYLSEIIVHTMFEETFVNYLKAEEEINLEKDLP